MESNGILSISGNADIYRASASDSNGSEGDMTLSSSIRDPPEGHHRQDLQIGIESRLPDDEILGVGVTHLPEPHLDPTGTESEVLGLHLHHDGRDGALLDPHVGHPRVRSHYNDERGGLQGPGSGIPAHGETSDKA